MKVVFLAACSALCVSSALASFDMMLLPNFSNRVNRYDPVNGVSLGGFNASNGRQVTIDQEQNRAFVHDSATGRIRMYNYNTGESLGISGTIVGVKSMDYHAGTNRLFSLTSSGIFYSTPGFNSSIAYIALGGGVTWDTSVIAGNVITVFGNSGTGNIVSESYNCATGASVGTASTLGAILAATTIGKPAYFSSPNVTNGYFAFSFINSGGNMTLGRSTVNSVGAAGVISVSNLAGFSSALVMPSAVTGHSGFFLVGQSSTTATDTLIRKYDSIPQFGTEYSQTISGTSFSAGIYQVANVVAPEPGSMIALGLGLAALVRKRRNRV